MPRPLLALLFAAAALCAVGALPARAVSGGRQPAHTWLVSVRSAGALKVADAAPAVYLVVLDDPPLAGYAGELPGLAATRPEGRLRLDPASPAATEYLAHLRSRQAASLAAIGAALGRDVTPLESYQYALNGMALRLTPGEADAVSHAPGVRLLQRDEPRRLRTDAGPPRIGAAQADLRAAVLFARLAAPSSPAASGRADAAYDAATARLTIRLSATGLPTRPTAALLVRAVAGQPDLVVADLTPLAVAGADAYAGSVTLADRPGLSRAAAEAALLRGELELVVATAAAPQGLLRGALLPARGDGVIAGVIDSGINPFGPSFAAVDDQGRPLLNPLGAGVYKGVCDPLDPGYQPDFPCNARLVGAYALRDTGVADPQGRPSPFDDDGHGSHVAGTLAGSLLGAAAIAGVSVGPLAGVAPHAALIAYDACDEGGCSIRATVAAIDRAVADGAAVINYSAGGAAETPWGDATALAMLGALEAGVLSVASAGNAGPDSSSVETPANAPWVMAVGATSHGRRLVRLMSDFSGGVGAPPPPLSAEGLGATAILSAPIVSGAALPSLIGPSNEGCLPFAEDVRLDGAIVVCLLRGSPTTMAANVARAGGAALVVVWPPLVGRQLPIGVPALPTASLDAAAGGQLLSWLSAGAGHRASLGATAGDLGGPTDTLAYFSSRGPDAITPDLLKPDLAAPGLNVLAPGADTDPGRDDYELLSGTSMAAPHAAGAAALLRQIHPDWTPAELRSALMTTADPALRLTDEATLATAHDVGAGLLRVDRAARAGLLLDATGAQFRAADPALSGNPSALNLPALSRELCFAPCVFTRTVRSALAVSSTWTVRSQADSGLTIAAEPARFTLAPGASRTMVITATLAPAATTLLPSYLYGAVLVDEENGLAPQARLPVAVGARAALLPSALYTRTLAPDGSMTTPELRSIGTDELSVRVLGLSRGERSQIRLGEDATPNEPLDGGAGIYSTTLALPDETPRVTAAVVASTAPDIDLLIYADGVGGPADGVPQEDELVCLSATLSSSERCDLLLAPGPGRALIMLVQNYTGSGAPEDSVDLLINLVPGAAAGNLASEGPATVVAGEPYSLRLTWALPDTPEAGGLYQGVIELSTSADPARAGDLGWIPVDLDYLRGRFYLPVLGR